MKLSEILAECERVKALPPAVPGVTNVADLTVTDEFARKAAKLVGGIIEMMRSNESENLRVYVVDIEDAFW